MHLGCPLVLALLGGNLASAAPPSSVNTADGVSLSMSAWGEGERGVVLLHGHQRSGQDWSSLGPRLASSGFHVVAVDLRGHGQSQGPSDAYSAMTEDVRAAVGWLTQHGATQVQLVGAAFGANLALAAAADDSRVQGVVLLSPQLNAQGYKPSTVIGSYGPRPLLIVASEEDLLSARAAKYLDAKAQGPHTLELLSGAGSGARMLNAAPTLEPSIVAWLQASPAPSAAGSTPANVRTGQLGDLQTQGTLLENRNR